MPVKHLSGDVNPSERDQMEAGGDRRDNHRRLRQEHDDRGAVEQVETLQAGEQAAEHAQRKTERDVQPGDEHQDPAERRFFGRDHEQALEEDRGDDREDHDHHAQRAVEGQAREQRAVEAGAVAAGIVFSGVLDDRNPQPGIEQAHVARERQHQDPQTVGPVAQRMHQERREQERDDEIDRHAGPIGDDVANHGAH